MHYKNTGCVDLLLGSLEIMTVANENCKNGMVTGSEDDTFKSESTQTQVRNLMLRPVNQLRLSTLFALP